MGRAGRPKAEPGGVIRQKAPHPARRARRPPHEGEVWTMWLPQRIRAGTRAATRAPSASSRNPATSINGLHPSHEGEVESHCLPTRGEGLVSNERRREPVAPSAKPAMLRRMMHIPRVFQCGLIALLLALAPAPHAYAFEAPEGASGFTPKPLVKAKTHMVVAANPLAAEAGLAILRKGGSAADAGIAIQMVLNLVEPQSSGIGGGGYILYWDAPAKKLVSIDGRETAPQAATPELFLDDSGKPLPREAAMASGLAVGVPGVLAALKLVHEKYG